MPKKKPEKARTTPAAPKAPAPLPAFFADLPTSALASSTSARISVETSAIALCTSVPMEGSSGAAAGSIRAGDALWATGLLLRRTGLLGGIVPHDRGARPRAPLGRVALVLRRGGGELVLDQVHHGGI